MNNIVECSFTEEGMGSGKAIFEGGLNFANSEERKKFDNTASAEQKGIGEQLGRYFSVIMERAVERLLARNKKHRNKGTKSIYYLTLVPNFM